MNRNSFIKEFASFTESSQEELLRIEQIIKNHEIIPNTYYLMPEDAALLFIAFIASYGQSDVIERTRDIALTVAEDLDFLLEYICRALCFCSEADDIQAIKINKEHAEAFLIYNNGSIIFKSDDSIDRNSSDFDFYDAGILNELAKYFIVPEEMGKWPRTGYIAEIVFRLANAW